MPILGEVRFTFSTFVLLNSETGLSIACIFYLFVFLLLNIFFLFVLLSILCTLSSVCMFCIVEQKGEGGAVNSFVILINYHIFICVTFKLFLFTS